MWDDIIIGSGDKRTSAIHVFSIEGEHSISQNSVSYWISNSFLGTGLTIFKDTPEGEYLTTMIECKSSLDEINKWLSTVVLKHLTVEFVTQKFYEQYDKGYRQGKEDKINEIKGALEIFN